MTETAAKAWICPVCGYIHYGDTPPDECPVCGSPRELFEPYIEVAPQSAVSVAPAAEAVTRWICANCGYIHEGSSPPGECPVCGVGREQFEPLSEAVPAGTQAAAAFRVVILGAGIAGVAAAEALRSAAPGAEITLLSDEPHPPYYRLNLTRYLAGEVEAARLELHPPGWYAENRIDLLSGVTAESLDLTGKQVILTEGRRLAFDKLILANGAAPFVPPIPGADLKNVTTLRTREQADFLLSEAGGSKRMVCIGGGLLGLETAGALAKRGAQVTVLEGQPWLLPRQLNRQAAATLQRAVEAAGIAVRTGVKVVRLSGAGAVQAVELEGGEALPAEQVVISAGVRPRLGLAKAAGLAVNQGVLVDDQLRTSHPDVFAAGDVAEHRGVLYGTWGPAQLQGEAAGKCAAGAAGLFGGVARSNTLKVLGLPLFSIGKFNPEAPSDVLVEGEEGGLYACFLFQGGRLAGAILLGEIGLSAALKSAIAEGKDCSDLLRKGMGVEEVRQWVEGV